MNRMFLVAGLSQVANFIHLKTVQGCVELPCCDGTLFDCGDGVDVLAISSSGAISQFCVFSHSECTHLAWYLYAFPPQYKTQLFCNVEVWKRCNTSKSTILLIFHAYFAHKFSCHENTRKRFTSVRITLFSISSFLSRKMYLSLAFFFFFFFFLGYKCVRIVFPSIPQMWPLGEHNHKEDSLLIF